MKVSQSLRKYDVFLSFRGTLRTNFVSHLYYALTKGGIITFLDERELQKGNFIWEGIKEAMDQSRFAIVVISKDYATSRWCMKELSYLVDLAEKKRLQLIPIFYEIDPSKLKSRTGCFKKALDKHDKRFDVEMVNTWRTALLKVGYIHGWDSKKSNNDSKLVQQVTQDILYRLSRDSESLDETTEVVDQMSFYKKCIEALLSMDNEDIQMVGIWGEEDREKTTIAKYVSECLSSRFPCFLKDMRDNFQNQGVSHFRKQMMSQMFPKKPLIGRRISSEVMKRRLHGKKVLLY